jgi:hypothetical protein
MSLPQNEDQSHWGETERSIKLHIDEDLPYRLSPCDQTCVSCGALHWPEERTIEDTRRELHLYSICCHKGQVVLPCSDPLMPSLPDWLEDLFTGSTYGKSSFRFGNQGALLMHEN